MLSTEEAIRLGEGAALAAAATDKAPSRTEASSAADWDRSAAKFDDISYDQTAAYCDARWGRGRTRCVEVAGKSAIVGMARAVEFRLPPLPGGVAYVKFGPLWRQADRAAEAANYRAVLAALVQEFCRKRGRLLTIMPRPDPDFAELEADTLTSMGFQRRRPMLDPIRYFVNLRLDPSKQRASLGQKWRYHLGKALAADLAVGIETGPAAVQAFRDLHRGMLRRKQFTGDEAVDLLDRLQEALPPALRPSVVMARKDGRLVAGAIVEHGGPIATYVFGASNEEGLELRAGYALHWWIVTWLATLGKRWYDLGGGAGEPHLEQFKRGFVGKEGALLQLPGEFDMWTSASARLSGDLIYRARDAGRWARQLETFGFLRRMRHAAAG